MTPTVFTAHAVSPIITRAISTRDKLPMSLKNVVSEDDWMNEIQEGAEVDLLRYEMANHGCFESYNDFESR